MKVVILAAGQGSRLAHFTASRPKTMVRVAGEAILKRQLRAYLAAGLSEREIHVVAGYKRDKIRDYLRDRYPEVRVIENPRYAETNNMYSLWLALRALEEGHCDLLLGNGDNVFDSTLVRALLESSGNRIPVRPGAYDHEAMKIVVAENGRVTDIAKTIPPHRAFGVSMDLHKITMPAQQRLLQLMEEHLTEKGEKDWFETVFPALFTTRRFDFLDTGAERWYEVDTPTDLERANALFSAPRPAPGALKNPP